MKWSDKAIILSARRLGENSGIIHVLTSEHGLYKGVDRTAFGKAKRGLYQTGNVVSAHWQARLPEQLGMLSCELMQPVAATVMNDKYKLAVLSSAAGLVEKILPERERQIRIFDAMETLIHSLCLGGDYLKNYVKFEFTLLACAGFGIDVERCVATGQTHDLLYVSPKSGRAVSKEAGMPYKDKLLVLPDFLANNAPAHVQETIHMQEILAGIKLCGHFLTERVFTHARHVPPSRARLAQILENALG